MDWFTKETGAIIATILAAAGGLWATIRRVGRADNADATKRLNDHITRLEADCTSYRNEVKLLQKEFNDFKSVHQGVLVDKVRLEERVRVLTAKNKALREYIDKLRESCPVDPDLPIEDTVNGSDSVR